MLCLLEGLRLYESAFVVLEDPAICVDNYKEALRLAKYIGSHTDIAICVFNLGCAYQEMPSIRDLQQAETSYKQSLELLDPKDLLGRSKSMNQLGTVAYECFKEARAEKAAEDILLGHINQALSYHYQALDILPKNAVSDLAITHNWLGAIYGDTGHINQALEHFRESIRYDERQGNIYGAGQTRYNVALTMRQAGRLADAQEYARAALTNFQTFDNRAVDWIQLIQQLITDIEKAMP